MVDFNNPYKPGAGHMPPFLAGRDKDQQEFKKLLTQTTILENLILTGLRGVGKTVLLETFKPIAISEKWLWVGTDMSESTSVHETNMAIRILTDLSVITSSITFRESERIRIGFDQPTRKEEIKLSYQMLLKIYEATPGLVADKLKATLETVWESMKDSGRNGVVFAYDEAQNLSDNSDKEQFPLSLLLDVFQSIQKKGLPFMIVLTGLPTLFPKLVEARTYSERMFRVLFIGQLNTSDSYDAILKPLESKDCPIKLDENSVRTVSDTSGGYPYFIQFICREMYDASIQKIDEGEAPKVPIEEITRKLDSDFFAGRWSRATDRERELLGVAASLENCADEFTNQEIVEESAKSAKKPFSASYANQLLARLCEAGLVYKNRHGKYSFAVPLLHKFIARKLKANSIL
jgi:hypothetical protein